MTASNNSKRRPDFYADKIILAPMVRENSLPFRLLCLHYGADIVYTEELIDYRLSACCRLENKVLGTIDFVDKRGEVVLRTCPEEKDRLVLQIGSNNPDRALKAAKLACQDVAGLDFNFGCPKSFSLSGGMGAALLDKPDDIKALLTNSVENLDIPVTCKIRVLPDLNKTLDLVKLIESCGVSAIAVHGRTKDQRPRHENQDDILKSIAETISIPMIANGGSNHMRNYSDILKFKDKTKASSVMIARVAMKNPSIFNSNNVMDPIEEVIRRFLKLAVRYDNYVANSKYSIQSMLGSGHFGADFVHRFHLASDFKSLCDLFNLSSWYEQNKLTKMKSEFYGTEQLEDKELEKFLSEKRSSLKSIGMKFVCDNVPYVPRVYPDSKSPKCQLIGYANKQQHHKIDIDIFQLGNQNKHRYYCQIIYDNVFYLNKAFTNSKKAAEQATAMLVCEKLGLVDLDDYKNRTSASNRNVT